MPKNGSLFTGKIVTKGRVTGQLRTVELRLVYLDGRFYASTTSVDRKHWCKNMIREPRVEVLCGSQPILCDARILSDETRRSDVLRIRGVPGEKHRTVFEVTPRERP